MRMEHIGKRREACAHTCTCMCMVFACVFACACRVSRVTGRVWLHAHSQKLYRVRPVPHRACCAASDSRTGLSKKS